MQKEEQPLCTLQVNGQKQVVRYQRLNRRLARFAGGTKPLLNDLCVSLASLRGHPVQRLGGMFHLFGGAGAGRHHRQAALPLHLPQRVRNTGDYCVIHTINGLTVALLSSFQVHRRVVYGKSLLSRTPCKLDRFTLVYLHLIPTVSVQAELERSSGIRRQYCDFLFFLCCLVECQRTVDTIP